MAPIRVAVIGCGGIAAFTHVPQLLSERARAEIVVLCDRNTTRAEALRSRFNLTAARCTAEYREVLEDRSVDAVIVATWPVHNARIGIEVIHAGKHLLLQKPLLLAATEGAALLDLAQSTSRQVLALPYIEALRPFEKVREELLANTIGQIGFARIRTTIAGPHDYYEDVRRFFGETDAPAPYDNDEYALRRGCLSDMGPYALAAFHYLFGTARCTSARFLCSPLETFALLTLAAQNGPPLAAIESGWSQFEGIEICSIFGTAGSICMEVNGRTVIHAASPPRSVEDARTHHMLPVSPFDAQKAWLDAIAAGPPARFAGTVERAVWISEVIDDAYRRAVVPDQAELPR